MKNYSTGICFNCEARLSIHRSETFQCPKNGIEEIRFDKLSDKYYPQQWMKTVFEDSGIKKVENAAFDLLEACNEFLNVINRTPAALHHYGDVIKLAEQAIKKATD